MDNNLNVLFIDDSRQNVEIIATEFIKQGFNIDYNYVNKYSDLLDRLNKKRYDLIVSEFYLSTTSVTEVLGLLSAMTVETPLIVISSNDNEKDIIRMIEAGCRDYLVRSSISHLKPIVIRILCEIERYRKQKEIQIQLNTEKEGLISILENLGEGLIVTDIKNNLYKQCR